MDARVVNDAVAGTAVVLFWSEGAAAPLTSQRSRNRETSGKRVSFSAQLMARLLTFESAEQGRFIDRETGTTWTCRRTGYRRTARGSDTEAVPHIVVFWFAWGDLLPGYPNLERLIRILVDRETPLEWGSLLPALHRVGEIVDRLLTGDGQARLKCRIVGPAIAD